LQRSDMAMIESPNHLARLDAIIKDPGFPKLHVEQQVEALGIAVPFIKSENPYERLRRMRMLVNNKRIEVLPTLNSILLEIPHEDAASSNQVDPAGPSARDPVRITAELRIFISYLQVLGIRECTEALTKYHFMPKPKPPKKAVRR
jgi:hypothetical protein